MDKIHYEDVRELFKFLGINPYEFYVLSEGRTKGWFPDIPYREAKVNVKEFTRMIWGEEKRRGKWRFGR